MEEYIKKLLKELEKPSGWDEVQNKKLLGEIPEFGELFGYLQEHEEHKGEVLERLLQSLDKLDVYKACCISHFCGYLIETAGMGDGGESLVDFYAKATRLSYSYLQSAAAQLGIREEDLDSETEEGADRLRIFEEKPDEARAFLGIGMATLAVMDVITRSNRCRMRLRESHIYEAMQELQNFVKEVFYPVQVHDACWELELVVLAPETKQGFVARVNDLNNNFTLLAFLEEEMARSGRAEKYGMEGCVFRQDLYDYLNGAAYPKEQGSVCLHMGYTSPDGMMIWGEMPPETIPEIDARPVVIMKREGMISRSFDHQFVLKWHSALNPYFKIERELSPQEVKQWMEKVGENRR